MRAEVPLQPGSLTLRAPRLLTRVAAPVFCVFIPSEIDQMVRIGFRARKVLQATLRAQMSRAHGVSPPERKRETITID
jgi:hypothetical protein